MANIPLSITLNWKSIAVGLLVLLGILYYFSGYHWKPHRQSVKAMIKSQYLDINGVENAIFYRHVLPEKPILKVLLLHGQKFSSKTWEDIGTLDFLAKKHYEVLAVDLPSYGNSTKFDQRALLNSSEKAKFLKGFMQKLEYEQSVLIVPSMSGSYAIPYIFEQDNAKKLKGFVPIAPVGTEAINDEQFKNLDLKTLIVYGQDDKFSFVPKAIEKLKLIPNAVTKVIDGAGHACYIDHTGEFHSYIEGFLKTLQNKS